MREAVIASGCELVTVAVGRIDLDAVEETITDYLPADVTLLPNTAGSATADEAVRIARLARAGGLPDWIKLEVIPDPRWLLPDPVGTLEAAGRLVEEGFTVLPYVFPDPVLQKKLEDVGCAAVMPLASPIGSGLGLVNPFGIRTIKRRLKVPVIVDAGVGTASDACLTMEQGVDGILMNTALAEAADPVGMARAMGLAVEAGRLAYLAGRMPRREIAVPSSPARGMLE
jgi:thiazole synthase